MEKETTAISKKEAADLYLVASQFCTFIENIEGFQQEDRLDFLQKIVPLLYLKGGLLPEIELEDTDACEQFITEEEYQLLLINLRKQFENMDFFDYYDRNFAELQTYSFCELLTDIYQDLKDYVLLYTKGTQRQQEAAMYLCRHLFEQNWGHKLALLLPYLHEILFEKEESSDDWD